MLWITNITPEEAVARLDALHGHVRRSTRNMALVAVGAAAVQMVLDVTYLFCL
ncbi:MAG: hypothetical protein H0S80_08780 [Desulfovibrionaceae bacterium]|nr:hypothetical protein [Desulfovibrionaceae bacterium]